MNVLPPTETSISSALGLIMPKLRDVVAFMKTRNVSAPVKNVSSRSPAHIWPTFTFIWVFNLRAKVMDVVVHWCCYADWNEADDLLALRVSIYDEAARSNSAARLHNFYCTASKMPTSGVLLRGKCDKEVTCVPTASNEIASSQSC